MVLHAPERRMKLDARVKKGEALPALPELVAANCCPEMVVPLVWAPRVAQGRTCQEPRVTPAEAGRHHQQGSPTAPGQGRAGWRTQSISSSRNGYCTRSMVHPGAAARCSCWREPGTRLPIIQVQGQAGKWDGDKVACNIGPKSSQEGSQKNQVARELDTGMPVTQCQQERDAQIWAYRVRVCVTGEAARVS